MVKEVLRPHIDRRLPARQVARSHKRGGGRRWPFRAERGPDGLAVAQDEVSGSTNGSGSASASCGCTGVIQEP